MAVKLYPPVIEGALPAFFGTDKISVPFSMNRAVSASDIKGFALKIKTVSGTYIDTLIIQSDDNGNISGGSYDLQNDVHAAFDTVTNEVYKKFNVGQYYKVQLAYISSVGVGYYSTVGVIKYTTKPDVYIENFTFGDINQHNYHYVGVYSQNKIIDETTGIEISRDTTEKMKSCRFVLYNDDNSVFADSGEIVHTTQNDDVSYMSTEEFLFSQDLDLNRTYYMQFSVKTINGLEYSSSRYRVIQRRSIKPDIDISLEAELNYNDGYVKLTFVDDKDAVVSGAFLISRAGSKNGYAWEELQRFDLQSIVPEDWYFYDHTIEQGETYKYSLQQYNESGIYSERIISNAVFADFEDAFLYDGERQLKIRFNPKVSSLKNTIQETKVDTIGSQHPFIIRNGNVNYKEIPISGLISYHMDETSLFMSAEEFSAPADDYGLSGVNITAERIFKLAVLDWLNNGKPKLFRSPTEGNYIVRLMNVSLSPNDTLGRMLHTFSATGYEIAKYTMANLAEYKLIDTQDNFTMQTRWVSIDLIEKYKELHKQGVDDDDLIQLNSQLFYSITLSDMVPGTIFYITEIGSTIGDDTATHSIMIGATGSYQLSSENSVFESIKIKKRDMSKGIITYSYRSKAVNVFNLIQAVRVQDVPSWQYVGTTNGNDILDGIEDTRTQILSLAFMRFTKRDVLDAYIPESYDEESPISYGDLLRYASSESYPFYADMDCERKITKYDPLAIYHLRYRRGDYKFSASGNELPSNNEQYIVDRTMETFAPYMDFYYDPKKNMCYEITPALFDIVIDNEEVNIAETGKYFMTQINPESRPVVSVNNGIITEVSCTKQIITYLMEHESQKQNYPALHEAKKMYEQELQNHYDAIASTGPNPAIAEKALKWYDSYIDALTVALEDYKRENGVE